MAMKAIGFLTGRVGDAVMCSVAARQFKKQFPHAHLTFAVGKRFGNVIDLFKGLPYIDDIHVWHGTDDDWPTNTDTAFINLEGYDVVFDGVSQHTRSDWYNHLHYVEETCLMLGLDKAADLQCQLGYLPRAVPGLNKTITTSLFASGNQPYKTLGEAKIRTLFAAFKVAGYDVLQVGSTDPVIEGASNLNGDIYTAVDHICSAKVHLTIDTAFSWIASAYQRPLVGLYGRNYPDMRPGRQVSHHPVNPNATYIDAEVVDKIGIEAIIGDVKKYLV